MALEFVKGVTTARTTTGTTVVSPTGITDLKAVIVWCTFDTADGIANADNIFSYGYCGSDGGTVTQGYASHWDDDAAGTTSVRMCHNTNNIIKLHTAVGTVDCVCDISAMSATSFTMNWSDASTIAFQIHYVALGGSDITAARVGSFAMSIAATQDVTVNAGFGQPDLIFMTSIGLASLTEGSTTPNWGMNSVAKSDTERFVGECYINNSATNAAVASTGKSDACIVLSNSATPDVQGDLSAKASWPTDGFQISYSNQPSSGWQVVYLALKGTFTATIGNTTVPTAGAPQTQNLALASGTPKGGIFFTHENVVSSTTQTSGTRLGGFGVGATDGTNEGFAAIVQEDGNTAAIDGRIFTTTKALACHDAGNPATLQSEADGSISGSNVVLTWNDTDTVAVEYWYVLFGEAAAAATPSLIWDPAPAGYFAR